MEPSFPYSAVNLVGDGIMRVVTIALPRAQVLDLLPHGLELGPQDLTAPGEHPVIFHFQEMLRAHMTIPSLLPNLTYHEQVVGIPFTHVTPGLSGPAAAPSSSCRTSTWTTPSPPWAAASSGASPSTWRAPPSPSTRGRPPSPTATR